jgi:hypothetical protein
MYIIDLVVAKAYAALRAAIMTQKKTLATSALSLPKRLVNLEFY